MLIEKGKAVTGNRGHLCKQSSSPHLGLALSCHRVSLYFPCLLTSFAPAPCFLFHRPVSFHLPRAISISWDILLPPFCLPVLPFFPKPTLLNNNNNTDDDNDDASYLLLSAHPVPGTMLTLYLCHFKPSYCTYKP